MKKVFALLAVAGMLTFGANNTIAQEEGAATEEVVMDSTATEEVAAEPEMAEEPVADVEESAEAQEVDQSVSQAIKTKFS